jgi:hypothetical protein
VVQNLHTKFQHNCIKSEAHFWLINTLVLKSWQAMSLLHIAAFSLILFVQLHKNFLFLYGYIGIHTVCLNLRRFLAVMSRGVMTVGSRLK